MTLWLIGGHDPTGGAGITRDEATAARLAPALPRRAVSTAATWQGDGRPARAQARPAEAFARELEGIEHARAIKLGLVPQSLVATLVAALARSAAPCVMDPVLRASDGGALGSSAGALLQLLPRVTVVTPNRDETVALLGVPASELVVASLAARGAAAWLFKDVEPGPQVCDRLVEGARVHEFRRPRRAGADPRGTGCALATAIACGLAQGTSLREACARAIAWLDDARTHVVAGPDGRPHLA
ncbi:MAG: bifunctional hydroxymethylpyrimidine kinase/phosphomethylpyrimidine kinase [Nannocystaceae bacterium]|nr:bifunctional hydroxymethylpyrimidine kinase/phosphomethylpyrimidine kinase [Nannocystaceae bacterium]